MEIRKSSRRLIPPVALLALMGQVGRLAAQPSPAAKALTVERIVEERERSEALPRHLAWSPDGKSLSFIRTALRVPKPARGPSSAPAPLPVSDIWSIDG